MRKGIYLFTNEQICDIRTKYRTKKKNMPQLAFDHDTTIPTISNIVNNKSYRDVVCK